jgi:hypothetical protein
MSKHERLREMMQGRPALDRVLFEAMEHRAFMAFVLVGKVRMPVTEVLNLTWPMVDLVEGQLLLQGGVLGLEEPLVEMLFRAATRRREDRRTSPQWRASEWVFVDECGYRYLEVDLDAALARFCQRARVAAVRLEDLSLLDLG